MSARRTQPTASIRPADEHLPDAGLAGRLDALEDAVSLLGRHGFALPADLAGDRIAHARARLRHGTHHTVVALVGSTGSGKSSLLNALVGEEVARTGVTRPTTAVTQAVTLGADASGLLDLIGITRRHRIGAAAPAQPEVAAASPATPAVTSPAGGPARGRAGDLAEGRAGDPAEGRAGDPAGAASAAIDPAALEGLVLLDLPDFDSVTVSHRLEVDRLITLVDLLVWVTDPQKYADEALHDGYLRRFSGHADVMQVVLNKMDTVAPGQAEALLGDLARLLAQDGLPSLVPLPTSAVTPGGADVLRGLLAGEVTARRAALDRIDADLRDQATALRDLTHGTTADEGAGLPATLQGSTASGLAAAAGVDQIAAMVAAQHRRDASLATGWPPMRWLRRLRRAPLARLTTTTGNQVATAEVSRTLRATAAAAADTAGPRWADAASTAVRGRVEEVTAALDQEVSRDVQVLRQPPRWWGVVAAGHRLLLLVALVGALWLGGIAGAQALLLIDARPFTPQVGAVPVPTVLLLGGLLGGIILAVLARIAARVGARRQARRATASLRQAVEGVTHEHVMAPLQTVLADRTQVDQLLAVAAGEG